VVVLMLSEEEFVGIGISGLGFGHFDFVMCMIQAKYSCLEVSRANS
jgi:hypothetical protein